MTRPTTRPRRWSRRPVTATQAAVAVLAVALLGEAGLRAIDDGLPRETAGDTVEIELKYDQLRVLRRDGEPVDVVLLGNSTLDAGIDPALLAAESERFDAPFNAALLGAPLTAIDRWASDFVLATSDPDTVVVGLTPLDVPGIGIFGVSRPAVADAFEATFDRLRPSPAQRLEQDLAERSALVRRRAVVRNPGELWRGITGTVTGREPEFAGEGPVTLEDGRQVARDRTVWATELLGPRGTTRTYWGGRFDGTVQSRTSAAERRALDASSIDRLGLDTLMATIRSAGIDDIVVVIPPHHRAAMAEAGIPLGAFDRLADDLVAYAVDAGLAVVDLSRAQWGDADFFDPAHLSRQGGERFTRVLADALDQL